MAKAKHIHRYIKRFDPNNRNEYVWRCGDSDCGFFVYKKQEYVIEGRASYCWKCGKVFPMDEEAMEENMPRCIPCRSGIEIEEDTSATDFLTEFMSRQNEKVGE